MKLHYLNIENFRAIAELSLDFTDYLSRPQKVNLIVGPHGSGKTSILDAIHLAIKSVENPEHPHLREGLLYSPQQLVRGRGKKAKIELEFSLESEEIKAINEVYSSLGVEHNFDLSLNNPTTISWSFPHPDISKPDLFSYRCEPEKLRKIFEARNLAFLAVKHGYVSSEILDKIGGICYLDRGRTIRLRNSWEDILNGDRPSNNSNDVLWWLYHYYLQDSCWNREKNGESPWQKIQKLFNEICHPAELVSLESGPGIDSVIAKRNGLEYGFVQMSAAEQQVLRILVTLAAETSQNSLVLIDEVELNLDSQCQKRLVRILRQLGENNQYIFTTNSSEVMKLFYDVEATYLVNLDKK